MLYSRSKVKFYMVLQISQKFFQNQNCIVQVSIQKSNVVLVIRLSDAYI